MTAKTYFDPKTRRNEPILTAAETRLRHIAAARRDLDRLTRAVATLKKNTARVPADSWEWVGDWQAISAKISEVADHAESAAKISSKQTA